MSSALDTPPERASGARLLRLVTSSYLVHFLVFIAVLALVIMMLARQPEGCACAAPKSQIVLFALAGLLALVGTVLLGSGGSRSRRPSPGAGDRSRTAVVLIGTAVVLVAAAGLVGLW